MTDIDQIARRLSDLETIVKEQGYRIKALEKAHNPVVLYGGPSTSDMAMLAKQMPTRVTIHESGPDKYGVTYRAHIKHDDHIQWCECGRDVCRAPECPRHKDGK